MFFSINYRKNITQLHNNWKNKKLLGFSFQKQTTQAQPEAKTAPVDGQGCPSFVQRPCWLRWLRGFLFEVCKWPVESKRKPYGDWDRSFCFFFMVFPFYQTVFCCFRYSRCWPICQYVTRLSLDVSMLCTFFKANLGGSRVFLTGHGCSGGNTSSSNVVVMQYWDLFW